MKAKNVLIIEDEKIYSDELAATILKVDSNVSITQCMNPDEASLMLSDFQDVIFLDYNLSKEINGFMILEAYSDKMGQVVFMSSFQSSNLYLDAAERGIQFFLKKPFEKEVMVKLVKQLFGNIN